MQAINEQPKEKREEARRDALTLFSDKKLKYAQVMHVLVETRRQLQMMRVGEA